MKSNATVFLFGKILAGFLPDAIPNKKVRDDIVSKYHHIIRHAKEIDPKSPLMSSYALAAFFIAMNKADKLTEEENYEILEKGLRSSKLVRMVMGNANSYFAPKKMVRRQEWSRLTHKRIYQNDWVVDFVPGDGSFVFGYDYLACGVCKLCNDENCPQLAPYMCRLDYMLVDVMGIGLSRTQTLADGFSKCDFRFSRLPQNQDK